MKILSARIYDRLFDFIPKNAESYGDLFEIDSLNLLLGTNGSGKTRMLVSLANAINSPDDESLQLYVETKSHRPLRISTAHKKGICSIYYSALPYRRRLSRRKGIFNASPTKTNSKDNKRLESFGRISNMLGIKTQLEGIVEYSSLVFRSLLTPLIRKSKKIVDNEVDTWLRKLKNLEDMDGFNKNIDNDVVAVDKETEKILNKVEYLIEDRVMNKLGRVEGLCYLSTLEYLYLSEERKSTELIAVHFLERLGFIESKKGGHEINGTHELKRIANNTLDVVFNHVDINSRNINERSIRLVLSEGKDFFKIKEMDTAIQIEWSNQSSGLQALVEQFSLIENAVNKAKDQSYNSVLLLIDEGDAYLHLDWQRKYIYLINNFLGDIKKKYSLECLQLVLATHSPLLAADIPGDFVISLDSNSFTSTFAAPIEDVISSAFSSSSLGEFAAKSINNIYKRALINETTKFDITLLESIGDLSIKAALKKEMS